MTRKFDAVVLGAEVDGLVAATELAKAGSKVLLVEEADAVGGSLRAIEFAGGHVAPLVPAVDPTIVALGDGEPVILNPEASDAALQRRSARDAQRWPEFARRIRRLAGFLGEVYRSPPPRIDADSIGELFGFANLARRYRGLGREGMAELLHALPMPIEDLLDDEFETPVLKGALAACAVTDVAQGPAAAGTTFTFLHRHVELPDATRRKSHAAVQDAEIAARAAGVTIETRTAVRSLEVADGKLVSVHLASGEPVSCKTAISCLDPRRSLIELIDPRHHDPQFIHAVRNIRFRGVTTKVLVALDALPEPVAGAAGATLVIAPSIRYVERAYEATKYGRCSDEPFVAVTFQGVQAHPVAILHVQYTPYRLREGTWDALRATVAERAIAAVERHIPGFSARVRERLVLAPPDLEARFGLCEGGPAQGEMMLDQILFMRPVPAVARYATPIAGYFLCGAGTYPGAGMHGISGRLAARAALAGG